MGTTHQTVLERGTAEHSDRPHRGQASALKSKSPEPGPSGPRWTRCDNRCNFPIQTGLYTGIQEYVFPPTLVTKWLLRQPGEENSAFKGCSDPRCFHLHRSSCSTLSGLGHDTVRLDRDTSRGKTSQASQPI